ncbi:hypothetical protein CEXT_625301 [Caerostris extrusa]|uniref:Uncharacterized protein n=1 Tax=Caerostris extrusa TaxID=172846 RepID=A0AAV4U6E6_CAEEX|nr:hypothetical protein CEXT_625301 [Caerostris extrusa]
MEPTPQKFLLVLAATTQRRAKIKSVRVRRPSKCDGRASARWMHRPLPRLGSRTHTSVLLSEGGRAALPLSGLPSQWRIGLRALSRLLSRGGGTTDSIKIVADDPIPAQQRHWNSVMNSLAEKRGSTTFFSFSFFLSCVFLLDV